MNWPPVVLNLLICSHLIHTKFYLLQVGFKNDGTVKAASLHLYLNGGNTMGMSQGVSDQLRIIILGSIPSWVTCFSHRLPVKL